MKGTNSFSADVLDYVDQAIFLAKDGKIADSNHTAFMDIIREGMDLEDYIAPQDLALYYSHEGDAPLHLQVLLAGKPRDAVMLTRPEGQLFIVQPEPAPEQMLPVSTFKSVGHALRSPLSSLMNAAEILHKNVNSDDPNINSSVQVMRRDVYRLMHLACGINDMLAVETNEFHMYRQRTELGEFLQDICSRSVSPLGSLNIRIQCEVPQEPVIGWIDRQKLERGILNAFCNAAKYRRDSNGTLKLQLLVTDRPTVVNILITDDGQGVERGELHNLFKRHLRPRQIGDARWGLGYGLSALRQTCRLHGGTLTMESTPDHGTCVRIELPLTATANFDNIATPAMDFDYAGGFRHELVELADALPGVYFGD